MALRERVKSASLRALWPRNGEPAMNGGSADRGGNSHGAHSSSSERTKLQTSASSGLRAQAEALREQLNALDTRREHLIKHRPTVRACPDLLDCARAG